MSKVRIYEVAKELGMEQKALVTLFQSMGIGDVRNHMSSVDRELVERVRRQIEKQKSPSIVEERIRPGVMKRRAVGQKADAPGPEMPVARPSVRSAPSSPSVPEARTSSEAAAPPPEAFVPEPAPVVPAARVSSPSVSEARASKRRVPEVPASRPTPPPVAYPTDDVVAPATFSAVEPSAPAPSAPAP
ncbi:MAG TPA: translation initiation factor IF-2 N-terminal domain-containing protein, partial [Polyangiaceae bacterium]|nr:translation initiation factor IF-2 N-terminal domain-containing protein [Polyangiaceae bacterium]